MVKAVLVKLAETSLSYPAKYPKVVLVGRK